MTDKKRPTVTKDVAPVSRHSPQANCFVIIFMNAGESFSPPLFLSDSTVGTHAPSSALQEIRTEKRLTAQFHKTPPSFHFLPTFCCCCFYNLFISLSFLKKQTNWTAAVPTQVIYSCRLTPSWLAGVRLGCRPIRRGGVLSWRRWLTRITVVLKRVLVLMLPLTDWPAGFCPWRAGWSL